MCRVIREERPTVTTLVRHGACVVFITSLALLPAGRVQKVVIKNARHPCYLDAPEEFNATLLNFLNNLNKTSPPPNNKRQSSED